MTNDTTQNFLKALQEFQWVEPLPVSYRLYYDKQGRPLFYTMENLSGTYIEVDQSAYVTSNHNVRVVDGVLVYIEPKPLVSKLQPCAGEGVCCDPRDVCIVVPSDRPNQQWRLNRDGPD